MKKHAIIPIFIPHKGCPNDCVFCNQRKITARTDDVTAEDARSIIDTWLTTLGDAGTVEAAFYGGSFTGLTINEQSEFLAVTKEYKDKGLIDKVHLSTRPDYIDRDILDNLKAFSVDTIELGVQSFDDVVLKASNRGHTSADVYRAVKLIREYGFEFGIQLMIGLPGDSLESCIMSAEETVKLAPSLARLYPTIVLDDTKLYDMYVSGEYVPLTRREAVMRTKEMYKILDDAGITIMRVGLKSTDIIGEGGAINGGTYHPAFRQLVEGEIAKDRIEPLIAEAALAAQNMERRKNPDGSDKPPEISIWSNTKWYSNMIGHKACNKLYFCERFAGNRLHFRINDELEDGKFMVTIE
ncbi:MAG: radical SAM protein [Mogibacterium sp.]|nr:radical SAM protein [Mogibacterium sp.]